MSKQILVSIGREFGSGGHEIAAKIAEHFQIPLYDRNLLEDVAVEKGINAGALEPYDERPKKHVISRTVRNLSNSNEQNVNEMQFDYLRQKANSGESFVVVGRCSEIVLQDNPNLVSIFVLAQQECKLERVMRLYSLGKNEALQKMAHQDKSRKAFHNQYSKYPWGDSRNYHLCINSSALGVEKTAEYLIAFIEAKSACTGE